MNDATKRKEREMVQKEIDKLRGSIQTLTRSANPLGESCCLVFIIIISCRQLLSGLINDNFCSSICRRFSHCVNDADSDSAV